MSKFQYRKRNADAAKELAQGNASKYHGYIKAGIQIWTPSRDLHRIRVLPPTYPDPRSFGLRVVVHQNVGPDERTFLCLKAMLNQPDPIEERLSEARRTGQADEKWAWQMKPKVRVPTWIIDRDDLDKGPQIWPMAEPTDAALNRASLNARTGELIEIEHPDNGFDLEVETIKKRGKNDSEYTTYEFTRLKRSCYISESEQEQEEWLDYITEFSIDKLLVYESYDKIVEALGEASFGGGGRGRGRGRDDDDGPGMTRSERRRGGGRTRSREPDGDDMPNWARGESSSDSDDDAPMPQSRRRRGRQERDDEEESPRRGRGREESRDEEPAPRSRRRSAPEPEDDDPPPRRRSAPEPEDDAPRRRRSAPEPEDDDPPPRRRSAPADDADDPPPRRRSAPEPEDDDPPPRRRSAPADDKDLESELGDDGLPDEPPPRRSRRRG